MPDLLKAFREHLGCQNIAYEVCPEITSSNAPDDIVVKYAGIQMGLYLDADALSENVKGNVIGYFMISEAREEMELVCLVLHLLKFLDSEGLLRREGKAVCLVSGKGADGIWVYGEEGVEVEGADYRAWGGDRWMSRILSLQKNI